MSVSSVSSKSSASSDTSLTGRTALADNFETFLNIMLTQLKNQNPMNPTDTNQFTQQLVQYAGIEQQLKTNDYLKTMMTAADTSARSQVASYVGKTVTSNGDTAQLAKGAATWYFNVEQNATISISIKDSKGSVVQTKTGSVKAGDNSFTWDGLSSTDKKMADGTYKISITARDASGKTVSVNTALTGDVSGVDLSGTEPALLIGTDGARIPLSSVRSVREKTPTTDTKTKT